MICFFMKRVFGIPFCYGSAVGRLKEAHWRSWLAWFWGSGWLPLALTGKCLVQTVMDIFLSADPPQNCMKSLQMFIISINGLGYFMGTQEHPETNFNNR